LLILGELAEVVNLITCIFRKIHTKILFGL